MFQSIYASYIFLKSAYIGHQEKLNAYHLAELKEQFGYDPYYIQTDANKFIVQEEFKELYMAEDPAQDEDEDGFYHVDSSSYQGKISNEEEDYDYILVTKKKSYSILKEENDSPFNVVYSTAKNATGTAINNMVFLLPTVSL